VYRALGRSRADRQAAYRGLFRDALEDSFVTALRAATHGGWALGDARFARQVAKKAGRRATPLPAGRPPRARGDRRQLDLL
jgi:putative transposase